MIHQTQCMGWNVNTIFLWFPTQRRRRRRPRNRIQNQMEKLGKKINPSEMLKEETRGKAPPNAPCVYVTVHVFTLRTRTNVLMSIYDERSTSSRRFRTNKPWRFFLVSGFFFSRSDSIDWGNQQKNWVNFLVKNKGLIGKTCWLFSTWSKSVSSSSSIGNENNVKTSFNEKMQIAVERHWGSTKKKKKQKGKNTKPCPQSWQFIGHFVTSR